MARIGNIKHKKTMLFAAGALSALGFAPVYALPLFAAGMVFAFLMADEAPNAKKAALFGYFFGFGYFCAGFYWIANALLVDVSVFGWLYPIALLGTGAFFGLFFIPPFMVWHKLKSGLWGKILGFASTFVLCEYVRSFLFTGFPWNMAGSMFAFSDVLLQTASVFGTYGLSFLLLVITGACYVLIKRHYQSAVGVIFGILAVMIVFGVCRLKGYENANGKIKVRLVQPSIAQTLKWDKASLENNLKTYIEMSRQKGFENVDMVVWGETATAFNPEESVYYKKLVRKAVPQKGYLITGVLRYDEQQDLLYNSVSVLNKEGKTVAFYDKNHLVPFGEYIPLRQYLPAWVKPVANQIADFAQGEKFKLLNVEGLPRFGALICYEIIFPDEIVNRKNKPAFVVLVSNDGWYGQSFGPYQHFAAAKLRAVEEGVTVIRSANNGISAVINPVGGVAGKLDLNVKGVRDVFLPKVLTLETIYAALKGTGMQVLMLLVLLMCFYQNKCKIKQ